MPAQRVGDLSLLAGSPEDAYEHYREAMALCKAASDPLWCGAAAEGLAAALIAHAAADRRSSPSSLYALSEVVQRMKEAIAYYESACVLEVLVQVPQGTVVAVPSALLLVVVATPSTVVDTGLCGSQRLVIAASFVLSVDVLVLVLVDVRVCLFAQARLKLARYFIVSPIPPSPTAKKAAGSSDADAVSATHGVFEGKRGHYVAHGMELVTAVACCPNVDPAFKVRAFAVLRALLAG